MRQQQQMALARMINDLEDRFGYGIIYRLSQARPKVGMLALSTGSSGLDQATGLGGVPRGRISELFGPPSCGKTSIVYRLIANAQQDGGMAAFIDTAQTLDGEAMLASGVQLDSLLIAVPRDAREALEIAEILVRCRALDLVVLAAFDNLSTSAARLMSEALGKLNTALNGTPTALVFVHQGGARPRSPLAFYASLRIAFTPVQALCAPGGDVAGLRAQAAVVKNKLASPGRTAELVVWEGRGLGPLVVPAAGEAS